MEAEGTRIAENENKPDRRSLLGWVFVVVTILALGYWLARGILRDSLPQHSPRMLPTGPFVASVLLTRYDGYSVYCPFFL